MGGKTQRNWLSIIATISLLAGLAPGAAAQGKQQRSEPVHVAPPATEAAKTTPYGQGPPTRALLGWTASATEAAAVLAAIGRNPEKVPVEFDERLKWADSDGSLQVMVSLLDRDEAVERFSAANTVDLSWYGDDARFVARVTPSQLVTLLDSPVVSFVEPDYPITNFMSDSSADVSARTPDASGVYTFDPAAGPMGALVSNIEGLSAQQVTGAGVTVAVTDSGIDKTHRDFGGWDCEAGPYQPCDSRIVHAAATEHLVGFETSDAMPTTDLFSAHGTHVAGTIAGNGYYTRDGDTDPRYGGDHHVIGIAPSAQLVSVKNGDSASAAFADAALQWQLDHAAEFGIKVSSNSWGCLGGCSYSPNSVTSQIQRDLYSAGVVTTFAVGNDGGGPDGAAFSGFAQSPYVLAVAAYDDASDRLADFSSRGSQDAALPNPSSWAPETEPGLGFRRADVAAPGVNIWSAYNVTGGTSVAGGRVSSNDVTGGKNECCILPYQSMSGTSMATPHVSGAAAVLFGACPAASNLDVMRAIMFGADPAKINGGSSQPFEVGYGALDVRGSLERLLALPVCGGARPWESDEGWTPPPPPRTVDQCDVADDDWCEEWVAKFDGGSDDLTWPFSVLSPDGSQLAMTGYDHGAYPDPVLKDIVTAAFDTASGENLWVARYPAGHGVSWGGIAMSADKVFVVGTRSVRGQAGREMVTLAYDSTSGEQLWATTSVSHDGGQAIGVTPDGSTVVVVGNATAIGGGNPDIVTIAYDAATGEQRWLTTHGEPGSYDGATGLTLSPDGHFAYVTGFVSGGAVTIAYAVDGESAGEETWAAVYDAGTQGHQITVSSNGARVFVAAQVGTLSPPTWTITTLAYDATSGEQLWAADYAGGEGANFPVLRGEGHDGIAVSPDDDLVFVTGQAAAEGCSGWCHIPVLAYDQATGDLAWSQTYVGGDDTNARGGSVASSPDGALVYVGGVSWNQSSSELLKRVALAYDSRSGARVAVARYPGAHYFAGHTVLPDPDGSRVYAADPLGREPYYWGLASYLTPSGPEPTPTPTDSTTASPSPSESGSPSPSPSESPQPDIADVSFTDNTAESGQYSDATFFEGRLSDSNGEPIEGRELTFELRGSEATRSFTATTDDDGVASVTPTLDEKPGPHWLTVRFAGDDEHAGDADTASFIVDKEDSALELTEEKGKDKTLVAHLYDVDTTADGIAGRTIDFYAGAELIGSATTDSDGVATFKPPKQKGKPKAYEARFGGDDFYIESSAAEQGKGGSGGGNGGGGNGGRDASTGYGGKVLLM